MKIYAAQPQCVRAPAGCWPRCSPWPGSWRGCSLHGQSTETKPVMHCTRVLKGWSYQVPGHVSPGPCVQNTGLGAHSIQVYHSVHIGGHIVNGHPLVLTIDCVVEAALLGPHHPEPRAHAQTVQVTAVSVPGELSLHQSQIKILQILEQT